MSVSRLQATALHSASLFYALCCTPLCSNALDFAALHPGLPKTYHAPTTSSLLGEAADSGPIPRTVSQFCASQRGIVTGGMMLGFYYLDFSPGVISIFQKF